MRQPLLEMVHSVTVLIRLQLATLVNRRATSVSAHLGQLLAQPVSFRQRSASINLAALAMRLRLRLMGALEHARAPWRAGQHVSHRVRWDIPFRALVFAVEDGLPQRRAILTLATRLCSPPTEALAPAPAPWRAAHHARPRVTLATPCPVADRAAPVSSPTLWVARLTLPRLHLRLHRHWIRRKLRLRRPATPCSAASRMRG